VPHCASVLGFASRDRDTQDEISSTAIDNRGRERLIVEEGVLVDDSLANWVDNRMNM
jgi:hypothetical protein